MVEGEIWEGSEKERGGVGSLREKREMRLGRRGDVWGV